MFLEMQCLLYINILLCVVTKGVNLKYRVSFSLHSVSYQVASVKHTAGAGWPQGLRPPQLSVVPVLSATEWMPSQKLLWRVFLLVVETVNFYLYCFISVTSLNHCKIALRSS